MNANKDNARSDKIRQRYSRISGLYDFLEAPMERAFSGWRQELLAGARGRVLEVGVGTGKNLPYYPEGTEVTAIDFSPNMIARARTRRDALQLEQIELKEMDVQQLAFADDTFDTVVSTCVFCSVPLPVAG